MRIFVTGGTGFVGSHFLNAAVGRGHDVVALKRSAGSAPKVPIEPASGLGGSLDWLVKSMAEVEEKDIEGCQALVHLAAAGVSPQRATWAELLEWNVARPMDLFQTAHGAGVERFVVTGTFAEYGTAGERYEFIPTDAPLEPTFPYAASKAAFSVACRAFCVEKNAKVSYQRLFSAYGEGQHASNFWPSLKTAALAGRDFPMTPGEQIRDFISVDRVADALVAILDRNLNPRNFQVENLASGQPVALRNFATEWWNRFNAVGELQIGALPYRKAEVMRYVPKV